jgi:LmbE family N-acetylglucosaminyl deacetylase
MHSSAIHGLGTVLGVWAHPDDEAFVSAGLIAAARRAGLRVVVATATRGELGAPGRAADVARSRAAEMQASLAALGVTEHVWLGFADGGCAEVPEPIGAAHVRTLIEQVRPDTIVTFGPDGLTGHEDHRAVSRWVEGAWHAAGARSRVLHATLSVAFHDEWGALCDDIGVWMGDERANAAPHEIALEHRCVGSILDRKIAALRAHRSQTAGLFERLGEDVMRSWWAAEWFVDAPYAMPSTADVGVSERVSA